MPTKPEFGKTEGSGSTVRNQKQGSFDFTSEPIPLITRSVLVQTAQQWGYDPSGAFAAWLQDRNPPFRTNSKIVYQSLWDRFIRWVNVEQDMDILSVGPADVRRFLEGLHDVRREQRERYQQVITRAYDDILKLDPKREHPSRNLVVADIDRSAWRAAPSNEPMQFLTRKERELLANKLQAERDMINLTNGARSTSYWRLARDVAIAATLLGAGLKAGEIVFLSVNCKVSVPFRGGLERHMIDTSQYFGLTSTERRMLATAGRLDPNQDALHAFKGAERGTHRFIPIEPWVNECLETWMRIQRTELELDSLSAGQDRERQRLFPGNRRVTPLRPSTLMHPSTLVRSIATWGARGSDDSRPLHNLTPQKLRNSYGASLLDQGMAIADVERLMGYTENAASGYRLSQSWRAFCVREGLELAPEAK